MYVDVRWTPPVRYSIPQEQTYNKGPFLLVTVATLVFNALLSFLLRVYTRTRLQNIFAIDDGLMLVAALCALGVFITFAVLIQLGLGQQDESARTENILAIGAYLWSSAMLMIVSVSLIKLSVALFLLRIIQSPRYRQIIYCIIGLLVPLTMIWTLTLLLQCTPFAASWNRELKSKAHCISHIKYRNLGLFNSLMNAATDLVIRMLPLPNVWGLRASPRAKSSLMAILSLGLLSCAAAIARIPLIYNMWNQEDPLAHGASLCLWSVIEMTTGMMAACLPTLKPFLTTMSTSFAGLKSPQRSTFTPKLKSRFRRECEATPDSPPPSPYPQSYSTPTFLSLPRPNPARFHDHISDLDFDLVETPDAIMLPRGHSRKSSTMTMLSNLTDFTAQLHGDGCAGGSNGKHVRSGDAITRAPTRSGGLGELGVEVMGIKNKYAVSVTSSCGRSETCGGSEDARVVTRIENTGIDAEYRGGDSED